jgi:DNA-binding CsgD family transcriptional regulator
LAERSSLSGFQLKETASFDSKMNKKRHLKRKSTPEYRRINRYFKATKQYWKERNRRKQVLKLSHEGYTLQQIAKKLRVSYRTVRRDMVKLRPYIKGQFNKHMAQLQREYREKLNRELEGLSIKDINKRFVAITNLMFKTRKLSKQEIFKQHNNIIFVNMDKLNSQGLPTIDLAFSKTRFKTPYSLDVVAVKNNDKYVLGGLRIG